MAELGGGRSFVATPFRTFLDRTRFELSEVEGVRPAAYPERVVALRD